MPILKTEDNKQYIVLVKRSDDAKTNPGSHSGFFGWADSDEESLDPEVIAHRELLEELFIISKDGNKAFNLIFKKNTDSKYKIKKPKNYTQNLIKAWRKEKGIEIKDEIKIQSVIREEDFKSFDFIDLNGKTKVYILKFNLPLDTNDICIFDGEAKKEFTEPPEDLLDREIDVFNLDEFKNWWCENSKGSLNAEISFKTGKQKIIKGFIDRKNKNKISPTLLIILNKWLGGC
ncbi:MAG: hypothetical protein NTU58_03385 [Candidatus Nealsonbacteria bacterium]|nr:hypothetical protein [Candidatus Nealsonbacteria bacterium]